MTELFFIIGGGEGDTRVFLLSPCFAAAIYMHVTGESIMETRLTEEHIVVLAKTLIDLTIDGQFPKHLTPDLVYTVVKEAMAVIGTGIFTYEPLARWFPAHRESITEWDKRGYNRG